MKNPVSRIDSKRCLVYDTYMHRAFVVKITPVHCALAIVEAVTRYYPVLIDHYAVLCSD